MDDVGMDMVMGMGIHWVLMNTRTHEDWSIYSTRNYRNE